MNEIVVRTLGSGSKGNMAFVRCGGTVVLIDIGLSSQRMIRDRLVECGVDPSEITAALVSHCHGDHLGFPGLRFCMDYGIPVLGQVETLNRATEIVVKNLGRMPDFGVLQLMNPGQRIVVGDIDVTSFSVPHDVPTMGFVLRTVGNAFPKITVATDIGETHDDLVGHFLDADAIFIEANYNEKMLKHSPRGVRDRARVHSTVGHLGNVEAGRFVGRVFRLSARKPSFVTLMHLSEDHNSPQQAMLDFHSSAGPDLCGIRLYTAPRNEIGPEVRVCLEDNVGHAPASPQGCLF